MARNTTRLNADDTFTMGRARFERISAVEGIVTSTRVAQLFAEFDRQKLTPEQRRAAIRDAFSKEVEG